ncbi:MULTISPECIES: hypothetical protein [unclassified Lentimonas]|uniref:hypothetical protein n=1 Tax=unclassified Lentimonas TaxID=2630993 RepID=UPI001328950C|nr:MULTISPECIES: hypothetical protein [unclassified Lentimonas]CAA6678635.1 Unannotated [Lentimonas sp. CC4]CAA6683620.1 Unannotated [Lentimonas sp. CC6]CAA7074533.1 Unannotated [Lentimonas sp. CC4]CAA7169149.1 Unannotated [Lentimonas sp. CC21]CAA7180450.1 Unannotated [Lentimonas sp. CC8]
MENLKREWINGLRIIWRVFLLFFFVGGIYQIGKAFAMLTAELVSKESIVSWFLGIFGLLWVVSLPLVFPLIVSYVSRSVGLTAEVYDFAFSKRIKKKRREQVGAGQPDNPPVKL